jgi:hypothetical protein
MKRCLYVTWQILRTFAGVRLLLQSHAHWHCVAASERHSKRQITPTLHSQTLDGTYMSDHLWPSTQTQQAQQKNWTRTHKTLHMVPNLFNECIHPSNDIKTYM